MCKPAALNGQGDQGDQVEQRAVFMGVEITNNIVGLNGYINPNHYNEFMATTTTTITLIGQLFWSTL